MEKSSSLVTSNDSTFYDYKVAQHTSDSRNGWEVMKYSHMDGFYIIGIIIVCICIIGDAIRSNWFFAIGSLIGYLILSLSIIYPLHLRDSIFDVEFGNFTQWYYRTIIIHIVEIYHNIKTKPGEIQTEMVASLAKRTEKIRARLVG